MRRCVGILPAALALVVIASPDSPTAAGAPASVRIALGTLAPTNSPYHRSLLELNEKWRKASDGQVELVIFPGGTQGSEAQIVKRMNIGQLQAGLLSVGGLTEIDEGVAALQEIPMLFRTLAEEEYVLEKLRPELEKRLLARGFVPLFWGDSGWVRFFSRNAALRPDDFKSMKIFVTVSGSTKQLDIMQALGYRPVPLPITDAFLQLQTRGVDAVPTVPILALSGNYYRVAQHMLDLNFAPLVGAAVVTKKAWDAVPPAARGPMMQAAADVGRKIQEDGRRENEEAVATMKARAGLEVHAVTPPLEEEWRRFAEGIYPKIRGTMVPADMFDQARQLVSEYRASAAARR